MKHIAITMMSLGFLFGAGTTKAQYTRGTPTTGSGQPPAPTQPPGTGVPQAIPQQPSLPQNGPIQRPVGQAASQLQTGPRTGGEIGYSMPAYFRNSLYRNPSVSKSLGLTREQLTNLDLMNQRLGEHYDSQLLALGVLTGPSGATDIKRLRAAYQSEVLKSLSKIMTVDQLRRYKQLDYQFRGASALADNDVRSRLKITDDQIEKLCTLDDQAAAELQIIMRETKLTDAELQRRYESLRNKVRNRVETILDANQLQAWRKLTGAVFDFSAK
jgi:hypothetical protein